MAAPPLNNRTFAPYPNRYPASLVEYNPALGVCQLISDPCYKVVATDGGCRDNGKPSARTSYGIYFGRNSSYNICGLLPRDYRQTSNVAELYAAKTAVQFVLNAIVPDCARDNLRSAILVIKTDSEYVAKIFQSYIWNWTWDE
jgi:ribonuclease HI